MEPIYFQTATGFGVVDDPANVPPGATIITEAQYNDLQAQWEADQAAAFQAEMEAAWQRYRDAYAAYRQMGMSIPAAMSAANGAGIEPPDFEPT